MHGGEYPGIESAIRFAAALDPADLSGRVRVIHLANPPAFYAKRQYVSPLDDKNLNRSFPGDRAGSPTERTAAVVMESLASADFWVDLHGGDIHEALVPFTLISAHGKPEVVSQAESMARAYGIEHILQSSSIAGASCQAAAERGIPAILVESGQIGQLHPEAVNKHLSGLTHLLVHLGMHRGRERAAAVSSPLLTQFSWISSPSTGFFYPQATPGEFRRRGSVAGVIRDAFGDVQDEVQVPHDGLVLFMVTSLAIAAGEPLFAVAAP